MTATCTHDDHSHDCLLLVDDSDEDATQLLTVICDGDPRSRRGIDTMRDGGFLDVAYAFGGAA